MFHLVQLQHIPAQLLQLQLTVAQFLQLEHTAAQFHQLEPILAQLEQLLLQFQLIHLDFRKLARTNFHENISWI